MTANRAAHQAIVAAMTGQTGEGVTIANDTVSINLGPFIQVVKQRLVEQRVRSCKSHSRHQSLVHDLAVRSHQQSPECFQLAQCDGELVASSGPDPVGTRCLRGQGASPGAAWAPASGLVGAWSCWRLGIVFVRTIYLNALPLGVLDADAAASFYDTLVRFLRLGLRTVLVFGLVVALGAFLTGTSMTAVRTRAALSRGIGGLRGGAEKAGFRTGRLAPGSTGTSGCCSSWCLASPPLCWSSGIGRLER